MRTVSGIRQCFPLVIGENIPFDSPAVRSCIVMEYQYTSFQQLVVAPDGFSCVISDAESLHNSPQ